MATNTQHVGAVLALFIAAKRDTPRFQRRRISSAAEMPLNERHIVPLICIRALGWSRDDDEV